MSKSKKWDKDIQYDCLTSFWLCIHLNCKKTLKKLLIYDLYLRQVACLALNEKAGYPRYFQPKRPDVAHFAETVKSHITGKFEPSPDVTIISEP